MIRVVAGWRYMGGLNVNNEIFAAHSWYFRNALVRANYNDLSAGIHATSAPLELFFRNLIHGETNELKNRYLHVGNDKTDMPGSSLKVPNEISLVATVAEMVFGKLFSLKTIVVR